MPVGQKKITCKLAFSTMWVSGIKLRSLSSMSGNFTYQAILLAWHYLIFVMVRPYFIKKITNEAYPCYKILFSNKKKRSIEDGEMVQREEYLLITCTHVKIAWNQSFVGAKPRRLLAARQPSSRSSERPCLKRVSQSDRAGQSIFFSGLCVHVWT